MHDRAYKHTVPIFDFKCKERVLAQSTLLQSINFRDMRIAACNERIGSELGHGMEMQRKYWKSSGA